VIFAKAPDIKVTGLDMEITASLNKDGMMYWIVEEVKEAK